MMRSRGAGAVYIAVGSNKGNRRNNIRKALRFLREQGGIVVDAVSPFYETQPHGGPPHQRRFWNGVIRVHTEFDSRRLLAVLKVVEARVGRRAGVRWGAREVDLDILVRGRQVLRTKDLYVPHRQMTQRPFVLRPLADLAPRLRHPVTGKTVAAHLRCAAGSGALKDARIPDFL